MKKKISAILVIAILSGAMCAGFYYIKGRADASSEENIELTKVQKINTRDLSTNYPETPREVVKLFNKIITCYYGEEYTEEELKKLVFQAWELFDKELQGNNESPEKYLASVKAEIREYDDRNRKISQSDVCSSNEVQYLKDGNDELAYVSASYFVKEGNSFDNTFEKYVLRKDADDRWKILVFYQIEGESDTEEE